MKQGTPRYDTQYTPEFYIVSPHKPTAPDNRQICTFSIPLSGHVLWSFYKQQNQPSSFTYWTAWQSQRSRRSIILSMSSLWLWTARGRLDERCTGKDFIIFLSSEKIGVLQMPTVRLGSIFSPFNSSCFYYQLSRWVSYKQLSSGMARPDSTSWSKGQFESLLFLEKNEKFRKFYILYMYGIFLQYTGSVVMHWGRVKKCMA
jgi:hypothetical protein